MLSKQNQAILLMAQTKSSNDKAKPSCGHMSTGGAARTGDKEERVVVARVDAGREDWVRFKAECVLLKGAKR